jgi:protein Mpv17
MKKTTEVVCASVVVFLAFLDAVDAFASSGFVTNVRSHQHQQNIGGSSRPSFTACRQKKPIGTLVSLDVATIDAAELFDGSFDHYLRDSGITIGDTESAAKLTKKSDNTTNLLWAITGMALSISAVVNTRSLGSLMKASSSFRAWYLSRLEIAPLLTKCLTGGLISFFGDYGAQWFEWKSKQSSLKQYELSIRAGGNMAKQGNPFSIQGKYDMRRGLARFLECLMISSPLMHYCFDLFERVLPVVGASGIYRSFAALMHVLADCILLDAIFVMTGITFTSLLEGKRFRKQVIPNLQKVYLPTLKASVMTCGALMPLQFLSFRFLPLSLRVLSVNAIDLIWTGVVSFVSHGA